MKKFLKRILCLIMTVILSISWDLSVNAAAPTVDGTFLYANGAPLLIEAAGTATAVYIDDNGDGVVSDGDTLFKRGDLSSWYIFGGGKTNNVSDTKIVMNGGQVGRIYGGSNESGVVTGNASIVFNGGEIGFLVFGGFSGSNTSHGTVLGNSTIEIKGGEIWGGVASDGIVSGEETCIVSNSVKITGNGIKRDFNDIFSRQPFTLLFNSLNEDAVVKFWMNGTFAEGEKLATVQPGADVGDMGKFKLYGTGTSGKEVYLDGTDIKIRTKPVINALSAGTISLENSGGDSSITVSGKDLPSGILLTAFENNTATAIAGTTTGSGTTAAATLSFPANITGADKVYTIKVSLDNGKTWSDKTCTVTVKKATFSASITPALKVFASVETGYSSVSEQQFVIKSTGTGTITGLTASLSKADFEISKQLSATSVSGNEFVTVSVKPVNNLKEGTYTDTLIISGDNNVKIFVPVSFIVKSKPSGKITVDVKGGTEVPTTSIKTVDTEVYNHVLTDEELSQVKDGADAAIYIETQNIEKSVPNQDKKAVEQAIQEIVKKDNSKSNIKTGMYLDISLFKKIGSNNPIQLNETKGAIKLQIEVPQNLRKENRSYMILRVHNGKADLLAGSYDSNTGMFSFETDKFSTYALVYSDKEIKNVAADKTILQLKGTAGNTSVRLTWKEAKEADGYIVYGSRCGKKLVKLKTIKNRKTTSYKQSKLKTGTYYKYRVVAYRLVNGKRNTIASSKGVHVITNGGKYANPLKVTTKVSKLTVSVGKTKTIKASVVAPKNQKMKQHIAQIRYESGNPAVAKVTDNGKIKGIAKGSCSIYVYAQNGVCKKISVTVK